MSAEKAKIIRVILIIAGSISVGLAMLGIILPVLPTTPFLLIAAACYIRSSEKLYNWLINNKYFGPYILNYQKHKGIPLHAKIIGIALLWLTIGYSAIYIISIDYIKVILLIIAVGVTIYLISLKTIKM
jgi:uncharacterized protein